MTKVFVRGEPKNKKDLMTLQEVIDYLTTMGNQWNLMSRPARFFTHGIDDDGMRGWNIKTVFGFDGDKVSISLTRAKQELETDDDT